MPVEPVEGLSGSGAGGSAGPASPPARRGSKESCEIVGVDIQEEGQDQKRMAESHEVEPAPPAAGVGEKGPAAASSEFKEQGSTADKKKDGGEKGPAKDDCPTDTDVPDDEPSRRRLSRKTESKDKPEDGNGVKGKKS
eukprot:4085249-Alexandrium_andersonii.AAC.1